MTKKKRKKRKVKPAKKENRKVGEKRWHQFRQVLN